MKDFDLLLQEYFGRLTTQELSIMRSYFHEEKLKKGDFLQNPIKYVTS